MASTTIQQAPAEVSETNIPSITLRDLPAHAFQADMNTCNHDLVMIFERYPNLPGIIILKEGEYIGMIPRKKFFELLSRPFGVEVYLKRSAEVMINHLNTVLFQFPPDTEINAAVQKALSRQPDEIYDPILTEKDGQKVVIDMYTLLIAMARSLDNANQIITKQFQIAHQITEEIDYENIHQSILEQTRSVLVYDEGVILRDSADGWKIVAHQGLLPIRFVYEFLDNQISNTLQKISKTHGDISCVVEDDLLLQQDGGKRKLSLSALIVPLHYSEDNIGAIILVRFRPDYDYHALIGSDVELQNSHFIPFQKLDEIMLGNLESTFSSAIRNTQLISKIQDLSVTDALTNIRNRRGFYQQASTGFERSKQLGQSFCILIIDIDHFKSVNDLFGHAVGDEIIQKVVTHIKGCLRETDLLGRFGGDEFVIMLPDSDIEVAENVAERIRKELASVMFDSPKGGILITVSIGVSILDDHTIDLDSLIKYADEALLYAKQAGRNQITIYDHGAFYNKGLPVIIRLKKNGQKATGNGLYKNQLTFSGMDEMSLEQMIDDLIEGYVHALELRDKETEGHTQRVARLTEELAVALGIDEVDLIDIRRGALLHDIGKIAIPDKILLKPGELNTDEWEIMKKHPIYAYDLLSNNIFLRSCIDIPYNHHERWDGSGYPRQLEMYQIPMAARIFSIIDVWDALISHRTYRPAWSRTKALEYIKEQSGRQFDPGIVPLFLELIRQKYPLD